MKVTTLTICLLAFLFTFPSQTFVAQASAATITVNSAADTIAGGDGQCTLREAIMGANADVRLSSDCVAGSGADTINFTAALINKTITLTQQINITDSLTINAQAAPGLSVSGNNSSRVFELERTVVMSGFRITGGKSTDGGAIYSIGNLTLNNMVIEANAANGFGGGVYTLAPSNRLTINGGSIRNNTAGRGGAIAGDFLTTIILTNAIVSGNVSAGSGGDINTAGGTLNITGGSVTGNTATEQVGGGIITINATVTVTNANITNNHADGSFGGGGGMHIAGGSSLTIINSTVSGNTAREVAGGIYFIGGGTHSITGTTLSGNAAGSGAASSFYRGGGGLANSAATVNISNSTVSGNSSGCNCGGGGISTFNNGTTNLRNVTVANNSASAGPGGGITSNVPGPTLGTTNVGNTIIADNTATANSDVSGAIVSRGFNLVRMRGTSTGYVASDLPNGSNPMLQALGNNGGPTQTRRLLAGSAAVDRGSNVLAVNPANNAALITDQRGTNFPRIVNGDGAGAATVDIGAFEAPLGTTAASVSVSGRVVTQQGRGIRNVVVTMTDMHGNTRTTTTGSFGYYRFEEVAAGETYIIIARGKRYTFSQPVQVLNINEDTDAVDFIADSVTQTLNQSLNQ